jgi:hypothetical protein
LAVFPVKGLDAVIVNQKDGEFALRAVQVV